MNKEQIYVAFRKKAESNDKYFNFGKYGIIEDTLAYFGLSSKEFKGTSSWVHEDNLKTLHDFMLNEATDEQLGIIYQIATGQEKLPEMNPVLPSSGKVFVSMPMNKEKYDCVDQIRNGTKAAIELTGNKAYYVDLDAHNGNISDKIIEEIRNCKFLIADFTCQNTGVYFEVGYAKGIGKTVIYTCRQDDFANIHFDIKQIQFVVWTDETALKQKLREQIQKSGLAVNN
ncbi:hypothetical protein [Sellimonas intestinalis]|uniref:hypothetical protein n=1 Tax=Sellimonas intestinalis TaxID=1653434 RepID=UPI003AB176E2